MSKKQKESMFADRLKRVKEAQKTQMKEGGFNELVYFPVGETTLEVLSKPLREAETKYGNREIFSVVTTDENNEAIFKDWMINPASPLFREVLEALNQDKFHFIIVRSGEGKQTRYSIKKSW